MKPILLLLTSLTMISPILGSEITFSLKEKVTSSKHVVIGKVIRVTKTDKYPKVDYGDRIKEGIIIELRVSEIFKGHKKYKDLKIHTAVISASAGFRGSNVKKDKEFLAYLKEKDGYLTLTGFSVQYLEPIDRSKNEANDIGQNLNKVKLDKKINDIVKITQQPVRSNTTK